MKTEGATSYTNEDLLCFMQVVEENSDTLLGRDKIEKEELEELWLSVIDECVERGYNRFYGKTGKDARCDVFLKKKHQALKKHTANPNAEFTEWEKIVIKLFAPTPSSYVTRSQTRSTKRKRVNASSESEDYSQDKQSSSIRLKPSTLRKIGKPSNVGAKIEDKLRDIELQIKEKELQLKCLEVFKSSTQQHLAAEIDINLSSGTLRYINQFTPEEYVRFVGANKVIKLPAIPSGNETDEILRELDRIVTASDKDKANVDEVVNDSLEDDGKTKANTGSLVEKNINLLEKADEANNGNDANENAKPNENTED